MNCAHLSLVLFIETLYTSHFSTSIKIHLSLQEYIGKVRDLNPGSRRFLNRFSFEQSGTPEDCGGQTQYVVKCEQTLPTLYLLWNQASGF